jgi:hypothetical protein
MDGCCVVSFGFCVVYSNTLPLPGVFLGSEGKGPATLYGIDDQQFILGCLINWHVMCYSGMPYRPGMGCNGWGQVHGKRNARVSLVGKVPYL